MKLIEHDQLTHREDPFEVLLTAQMEQVASMVLEPGQRSGEYGNEHPRSAQLVFVMDGEGEALVDHESVLIGKGDLLLIEAGEKHQIIGRGNRAMRTLNFYSPPAY